MDYNALSRLLQLLQLFTVRIEVDCLVAYFAPTCVSAATSVILALTCFDAACKLGTRERRRFLPGFPVRFCHQLIRFDQRIEPNQLRYLDGCLEVLKLPIFPFVKSNVTVTC